MVWGPLPKGADMGLAAATSVQLRTRRTPRPRRCGGPTLVRHGEADAEGSDEVRAYVKNHDVGFVIPYTLGGEEKSYYPDFIARLDDGHGEGDLLNLIIEVTGRKRDDKETKVATARDMWVPAINNHGAFGRWAFIEIRDPWNAQSEIRASVKHPNSPMEGIA